MPDYFVMCDIVTISLPSLVSMKLEPEPLFGSYPKSSDGFPMVLEII